MVQTALIVVRPLVSAMLTTTPILEQLLILTLEGHALTNVIVVISIQQHIVLVHLLAVLIAQIVVVRRASVMLTTTPVLEQLRIQQPAGRVLRVAVAGIHILQCMALVHYHAVAIAVIPVLVRARVTKAITLVVMTPAILPAAVLVRKH